MIWIIAIAGLTGLAAGYALYSRVISRKLFEPLDGQPTPAHTMRDDKDFAPANPVVLFGHHFASIAGAGPIVGPLIAVLYFGWVPAVLWIVIGSVFLGGVHDFSALLTSVRHKGGSIASISGGIIGRRAGVLFSVFVYLTLILIVAVFARVTAATFVSKPAIVLPTFGLIMLAPLFGLLVYRMRVSVALSTIGAMVLLAFMVYLGEKWPITLPRRLAGLDAAQQWFVILMVYSYIASILPVWLLLQPRDYLSMWILFAGLAMGYFTVFTTTPGFHVPQFTSGLDSVHHVLPVWPMLFVIIACGAISGFHSLVAGGTTSKQLAMESHARPIGYGGMLMEGVLAFLVVLLVVGGLRWDPHMTNHASGYQFLMLSRHGSPIVTFGAAFGEMARLAPLLTYAIGLYMGMIMLNAFVLTSLDTSTRLARFIVQEFARDRGSAWRVLENQHGATLLTVLAASWFGLSGSYQVIWNLFGAANQLVAALTLLVVSAYLVGVKKPRWYTLGPGVFMTLTTVGALVVNIYQGMLLWTAKPGAHLSIAIRLGVAVLLILLAILVFYDAMRCIFGNKRMNT